MHRAADGAIVLSRRNLLALLVKLEQPWSARTLVGGDDAHGVVVRAETDEEHYDRPPGELHPESLALMNRVSEAIHS